MNRAEFQRLAEVRVREAGALLAAGLWDGAYYLAGYAVECGLKACILARVEQEGVLFDPDNKRFSERCWTHDLETLVVLAGLASERDLLLKTNVAFQTAWGLVKDWSEEARYMFTPAQQARDLLNAITLPTDGALTWIKRHW